MKGDGVKAGASPLIEYFLITQTDNPLADLERGFWLSTEEAIERDCAKSH